jgi:hypothetical protein
MTESVKPYDYLKKYLFIAWATFIVAILVSVVSLCILKASPSLQHKAIDLFGGYIICIFHEQCSVDETISTYVEQQLEKETNVELLIALEKLGIDRVYKEKKMIFSNLVYLKNGESYYVSEKHVDSEFFSDLYLDLINKHATVIGDRNKINKDDVPSYIDGLLTEIISNENKRINDIAARKKTAELNLTKWDT